MEIDWKTVVVVLSAIFSVVAFIRSYTVPGDVECVAKNEYIRGVICWHAEVVRVLIRLRMNAVASLAEPHGNDIAMLSALIECGRLYFPNIDIGDSYGEAKQPAYRGYKNVVLDFLVASYNIHSRGRITEKCLQQAVQLQRNFTSTVFGIVTSPERLERLQRLTGKYFVKRPIFEDYLKTGDEALIRNIWTR